MQYKLYKSLNLISSVIFLCPFSTPTTYHCYSCYNFSRLCKVLGKGLTFNNIKEIIFYILLLFFDHFLQHCFLLSLQLLALLTRMEVLLFRVWALLALIPFPGEAIWGQFL